MVTGNCESIPDQLEVERHWLSLETPSYLFVCLRKYTVLKSSNCISQSVTGVRELSFRAVHPLVFYFTVVVSHYILQKTKTRVQFVKNISLIEMHLFDQQDFTKHFQAHFNRSNHYHSLLTSMKRMTYGLK